MLQGVRCIDSVTGSAVNCNFSRFVGFHIFDRYFVFVGSGLGMRGL